MWGSFGLRHGGKEAGTVMYDGEICVQTEWYRTVLLVS